MDSRVRGNDKYMINWPSGNGFPAKHCVSVIPAMGMESPYPFCSSFFQKLERGNPL